MSETKELMRICHDLVEVSELVDRIDKTKGRLSAKGFESNWPEARVRDVNLRLNADIGLIKSIFGNWRLRKKLESEERLINQFNATIQAAQNTLSIVRGFEVNKAKDDFSIAALKAEGDMLRSQVLQLLSDLETASVQRQGLLIDHKKKEQDIEIGSIELEIKKLLKDQERIRLDRLRDKGK